MGRVGFFFAGHFIAYYGLMIVLGICISTFIAYFQIRRFSLVMNDLLIICGFSGLFGILGAKILYLIVSFRYISFARLTDINYVASLMSGGFVFLGGIGGVILALNFCKSKYQIPVQQYIQSCIGCIPIGHAFGRIGCFLVGCCHGVPYTGWLSVTYTESLFAPCGVELFPVQLVEAAIELILGIFLLMMSSKLQHNSGLLLYLIGYSLSRFCLEFLRYDETRGRIAGMPTSQFLSALLFILAGFSLIVEIKFSRIVSTKDNS